MSSSGSKSCRWRNQGPVKNFMAKSLCLVSTPLAMKILDIITPIPSQSLASSLAFIGKRDRNLIIRPTSRSARKCPGPETAFGRGNIERKLPTIPFNRTFELPREILQKLIAKQLAVKHRDVFAWAGMT